MPEILLKSLLGQYAEHLKTILQSTTVYSHQNRLEHFLTFCRRKNKISASQLDQQLIRRYQLSLRKKSFALNTQYVALQSLKAFLIFLYQNRHLKDDLGLALSLPKWQRHSKRNSDAKKIKQLTLHLPKEALPLHQAVLALYFLEKLSLREIAAICTDDSDFQKKELRLRTSFRFIKLKKSTVTFLKSYAAFRAKIKPDSNYFFVNQNAVKIMQQSLAKIVADLKPS